MILSGQKHGKHPHHLSAFGDLEVQNRSLACQAADTRRETGITGSAVREVPRGQNGFLDAMQPGGSPSVKSKP